MTISCRSRLASLSLAVLGAVTLFADPARSADVSLAPRYRVGDSYTLSLHADRDTDASWKGRDRNAYREDVRFEYAATVVVLETDASGRPIRERHDGARLLVSRPEGSASLFRDGASLEIRRDGDDVEVFAAGEPVERRVERVVARLLETRFEHGVGPELFAPGRAVEVGESWELDPDLARRFLREHGVRAVKLDGAASATLAAGANGALAIRYAIPVAWFEADDLPVHASATESTAQAEGEIPLSADGAAAGHGLRLSLQMDGVVKAPGFTSATPWRFASERRSDERTQTVRRTYASGS